MRTLVLCAGLAPGGTASAVDSIFSEPVEEDRAGSGSVSIGWHAARADTFYPTTGPTVRFGEVKTHAAALELEYYLSNRWSIEASVPFIKRRYQGARPHRPERLTVPQPDSNFLDDGEYHGGLQDFRFVVRYDAIQDSMLLRPFVAVVIPSRDYTFFAQSAIGQNLHKGEIGAELIKPIGLSDFYVRGLYAYEILERSYEGRNTNHHLTHLELGWYAKPQFVVRGFLLGRYGNGMGSNADFAEMTNERWYYHDQTQRHDSAIAGFGLDYAWDDRHVVSLTGLRSIDGEAVHKIDFATGLELTWHFDRGH
jgi:hypothetical protein